MNVPYRFSPIKKGKPENKENVDEDDGFQKYSKHYKKRTKSFTTSSNSLHNNYSNYNNNHYNNHYYTKYSSHSYYKRNSPPRHPQPHHLQQCPNNNKHFYECNNCGKYGHSFNHCKMPIISFGLIAVRYDEVKKQLQYL